KNPVPNCEDGLQYHRVATIGPGAPVRRVGRRDPPATVIRVSQQSGEPRRAVETGPAQQVDRAFPADQGRRPAIADKSVVLNPQRTIEFYLRLACSINPFSPCAVC